MIDRVPATIGAMAVSRFTKTLKENNMFPEVCLGTHIKTRELWLTEKQAFRTIKTPPVFLQESCLKRSRSTVTTADAMSVL